METISDDVHYQLGRQRGQQYDEDEEYTANEAQCIDGAMPGVWTVDRDLGTSRYKVLREARV